MNFWSTTKGTVKTKNEIAFYGGEMNFQLKGVIAAIEEHVGSKPQSNPFHDTDLAVVNDNIEEAKMIVNKEIQVPRILYYKKKRDIKKGKYS